MDQNVVFLEGSLHIECLLENALDLQKPVGLSVGRHEVLVWDVIRQHPHLFERPHQLDLGVEGVEIFVDFLVLAGLLVAVDGIVFHVHLA
jgi:hypothetical protein